MNVFAGVYYCVALTGPGDPRWRGRPFPVRIREIRRLVRQALRTARSLRHRDPEWTRAAHLRGRPI